MSPTMYIIEPSVGKLKHEWISRLQVYHIQDSETHLEKKNNGGSWNKAGAGRFIMRNNNIIEFTAILHRLIERITNVSKTFGTSLLSFSKQNRENLKLHFCFLFLNWRLWVLNLLHYSPNVKKPSCRINVMVISRAWSDDMNYRPISYYSAREKGIPPDHIHDLRKTSCALITEGYIHFHFILR